MGARLVRCGWPGCPDVLGQLKDGRLLGAEVKGPTAKPGPEQSVFLDRIRSAGGVASMARDCLDALRELQPMFEAPGSETKLESSVLKESIELNCDDCEQCPNEPSCDKAPVASLPLHLSQVGCMARQSRRVSGGLVLPVYVVSAMMAHLAMLSLNAQLKHQISTANCKTRNTSACP